MCFVPSPVTLVLGLESHPQCWLRVELLAGFGAPNLLRMRGGWSRFGIYILITVAAVAAVLLVTRQLESNPATVFAQFAVIGLIAFGATFVIWPRRTSRNATKTPQQGSEAPTASQKPPTAPGQKPGPTRSPENSAESASETAGTRPGPRTHSSENPASRGSRGRRPEDRPQDTGIHWPASH